MSICLAAAYLTEFVTIIDDGLGFPDKPRSGGLGLRLMPHAADLRYNIRCSEKWQEWDDCDMPN